MTMSVHTQQAPSALQTSFPIADWLRKCDWGKYLIMTMLIPIVLGLMYRSHSTKATLQWTPVSCSEFLTQRNPAQTLSRSFETGLPA